MYSGVKQVLRCKLCVVRGGRGVAAYYASYIYHFPPLPWSPAYSPIVSELLHIITTNYPQQLNNLPLMHLGEYSGGWVVGVGWVGGLSFPGLSLPDPSNLSAFCASKPIKIGSVTYLYIDGRN